jgi:hypothetical protein
MVPLMPPRAVRAPKHMKLRRVKAYTTATGKDYGRWDVTLPPEMIEALGWQQGDELEATRERGGIHLRKKE